VLLFSPNKIPMDEYMEQGQDRPKTEAQKIGNALYKALQAKYSGYELTSGYTVKGVPEVVRIDFKMLPTDPEYKTALDAFQEDVQELLSDYEFDHNKFLVSFETNDETHIIKISEVTT
jgi:hypothetical protein